MKQFYLHPPEQAVSHAQEEVGEGVGGVHKNEVRGGKNSHTQLGDSVQHLGEEALDSNRSCFISEPLLSS